MALQRGREAEGTEPPPTLGFLYATGRMVGFLMLTVPAMLVVAAVVLIPEYSRLRAAQYEHDLEATTNADLQTAIDAHDRLNSGLQEDDTLIKRFAMSELNLQPRNEYVSAGGVASARPVGTITPYRHPRPATPPGWLVSLSAKLEDPPKRRGLLLVATGALLGAMFLFSPPEKYGRREEQDT